MRFVLFFLSALTLASAFAYESVAKSAIHEGVAAIIFVNSAVLFIGACIVDAIERARKEARDDNKAATQSRLDDSVMLEVIRDHVRAFDELLGQLTAELQSGREASDKFSAKMLVFLHNIDTQLEHTNKMLEWLGRARGGTEPTEKS